MKVKIREEKAKGKEGGKEGDNMEIGVKKRRTGQRVTCDKQNNKGK